MEEKEFVLFNLCDYSYHTLPQFTSIGDIIEKKFTTNLNRITACEFIFGRTHRVFHRDYIPQVGFCTRVYYIKMSDQERFLLKLTLGDEKI